MKRTRLIAILGVIVFLFLHAGCATPENTNSTNANMATPQATPDTQAITAEITRIENDWPRIIKERDGATVRKIEADDVVIVYPEGNVGGKEEDAKDIEAGSLTYDAWEISDLNVKVLDNDSAVAILRITVKNGKFKAADGRSQDISGQYRVVDTYARRNGEWKEVASAMTKIKEPTAESSPTPKASPTVSASPITKPSPVTKPSPIKKPSPTVKASPAAKPTVTKRPPAVPAPTP